MFGRAHDVDPLLSPVAVSDVVLVVDGVVELAPAPRSRCRIGAYPDPGVRIRAGRYGLSLECSHSSFVCPPVWHLGDSEKVGLYIDLDRRVDRVGVVVGTDVQRAAGISARL